MMESLRSVSANVEILRSEGGRAVFHERDNEVKTQVRMATRKKMDRLELAARMREVRSDLYGEHGAPLLANALGIPARTWINYESGVTVPATIVLALIAATCVNPSWLLHGRGEKYDAR
jgi:hypothetical protein